MQIDNAAIAKQLGYSKEEMIAKFGAPGEKTPTEIANALGLSEDEITNIFGDDKASETKASSDTDEKVDSETKTQDNKYKQVADALGYDELSVSAVMKAVANGTANGRPEEVVPQLAKDLGLPQDFVSNVLSYLNNGQI